MKSSNSLSSGSYADVNGARLYYEAVGQGPELLLLHAGVADSRMWDQQWHTLGERFRVIRFDMRGFGNSYMPPGAFANHEDVAGLLDHIGVRRSLIMGVSFGGKVALDFALAYPGRVTGLVLGAPSVGGAEPSERIRQFWAEEEAALERGDLEAATEANLRLWVDGPQRTADQVPAPVREQVREMQMRAFSMPIPDDVEERPLSPPAQDRLSELRVPTLIIVGGLDLPEKVEQARQIRRRIPQAKLKIIDDAAHMMNMERSAEFNRLVIEFLEALPA